MDRTGIMDRRRFGIMTAVSLLGVSACAGTQVEAPAPEPSVLSRVGIQLYTIRETVEADPRAAMQAVKDAGYSEVEFGGGGYFERDPMALRDLLDQTGLTAPSMHVGPLELSERMDEVVAMAKAIGAKYVVLAWVPPQMRVSKESWQQVANLCTQSAQTLAEHDIAFAYHNHDFEFIQLASGQTAYQVLTEGTDPNLVKLEVDMFWADKAGQDLIEMIDTYAGRIHLCHVKDRNEYGMMCLPGEGGIDFQSVFLQARKAGLQHFFVENDDLKKVDPLRLERAQRHLSQMQLS